LKKIVVFIPETLNKIVPIEVHFEAKGDELVAFTNQQGELVIHDVTNTPPTEPKVIINTLATFKEWIYWRKIE